MIKHEVTGFDLLASQLLAMGDAAGSALAAALEERAEAIVADSQEHFVPVDESILKGSGFVQPAVITPGEVSVTMGYGGAAQDYAMVQHENEAFHHTVGQAHYLSEPTLAAAPSLPIDLAYGVERALERLAQ